jgi:hypothetical protein
MRCVVLDGPHRRLCLLVPCRVSLFRIPRSLHMLGGKLNELSSYSIPKEKGVLLDVFRFISFRFAFELFFSCRAAVESNQIESNQIESITSLEIIGPSLSRVGFPGRFKVPDVDGLQKGDQRDGRGRAASRQLVP